MFSKDDRAFIFEKVKGLDMDDDWAYPFLEPWGMDPDDFLGIGGIADPGCDTGPER
jgi:hypothetical protein